MSEVQDAMSGFSAGYASVKAQYLITRVPGTSKSAEEKTDMELKENKEECGDEISENFCRNEENASVDVKDDGSGKDQPAQPNSKGQNHNRKATDIGLYAGKGLKQLCKYVALGKKCTSSRCSDYHDVALFMKNRPADLGDKCVIFEKFGYCPSGISCRFGASHIDFENNCSIEKPDKIPIPVESNPMDEDTVKLLRKLKYPFRSFRHVQRWTKKDAEGKNGTDKGTKKKPHDEDDYDAIIASVRSSRDSRVRPPEMRRINFADQIYIAPLTTVGNLAFRRLMVSMGADITVSEMVLAQKVVEGWAPEWALMRRHPDEKKFGIQVAGASADVMTRFAEVIDAAGLSFDFVDINCGCPLDMLFNKGMGSGLLQKHGKLKEIVTGMSRVLSVPLTIKLRTGIDRGSDTRFGHKLINKVRLWSTNSNYYGKKSGYFNGSYDYQSYSNPSLNKDSLDLDEHSFDLNAKDPRYKVDNYRKTGNGLIPEFLEYRKQNRYNKFYKNKKFMGYGNSDESANASDGSMLLYDARDGSASSPASAEVPTEKSDDLYETFYDVEDFDGYLRPVSAITMHGRTRQARYSQPADWNYIGKCVEAARNPYKIAQSGLVDFDLPFSAFDTFGNPLFSLDSVHPSLSPELSGVGKLPEMPPELQAKYMKGDSVVQQWGHKDFHSFIKTGTMSSGERHYLVNPPPIPLIGNGDVMSYADWEYCKRTTGAETCLLGRGALVKPWLPTEIKEQREWDISSSERLDLLRKFVSFGLEHWGSDKFGVNHTRRFLMEFLSFTCRYIPLGVLERPQKIGDRAPAYVGRDDLETLMGSSDVHDWVKISEMLLGPVDPDFVFLPKHKSSGAYSEESINGNAGSNDSVLLAGSKRAR